MHYRTATAPIFALAILLVAGLPSSAAAATETAEELTGLEVFQRCAVKNPGITQQGRFTVILGDRHGQTRTSEYLRFWKDYQGRDGVIDKMLLFTLHPPDARGAAFMRIAYVPELEKPVDQWIYLPLLRAIRRVTIRDPGDRFLNSNLTYADVGYRPLDADDHRYLGMQTVDGIDFHVVESIPREAEPLYGKRVFWFLHTDDWEDCVPARIDYYDTRGQLVKDQFIRWQRIDGAWVWDRVLVRSPRTLTTSIFRLSDVKINADLGDDLFSARSLERGPEIIERYLSGRSP